MSKKRPSNRLNVGERGTQEAPGRKRGCVFESEVKFSGIMGRERESESERERDTYIGRELNMKQEARRDRRASGKS